jgi:hypothetical protein
VCKVNTVVNGEGAGSRLQRRGWMLELTWRPTRRWRTGIAALAGAFQLGLLSTTSTSAERVLRLQDTSAIESSARDGRARMERRRLVVVVSFVVAFCGDGEPVTRPIALGSRQVQCRKIKARARTGGSAWGG